jgi:hypothetical protein
MMQEHIHHHLKGGQDGVKHIIQCMHEADLDYTKERAPSLNLNLMKINVINVWRLRTSPKYHLRL